MASVEAGEDEHEGSRRKASSKDPEGWVISATTCTHAAALLGEVYNQILACRASFADLAAKHSGCSSARLPRQQPKYVATPPACAHAHPLFFLSPRLLR